MPAMMSVMPPIVAMGAAVFPVVLALIAKIVPVRAPCAVMDTIPPIAAIIVITTVVAFFVSLTMPAMAVMGVGGCCDVQEQCCQRCQQEYA